VSGRVKVTAKEKQKRSAAEPDAIERSTSRIRAVVERVEPVDGEAYTGWKEE